MTFKHFQLRPLIYIPTSDCVICTSGEQDTSSLVHGHAGDRACVAFQGLDDLSGFKTPYSGGGICRPCDQDVLADVCVDVKILIFIGWNEDQREHTSLVASEDPNTFSGVEVPSSCSSVVGTGEDEVSSADHSVGIKYNWCPFRKQTANHNSFNSDSAVSVL